MDDRISRQEKASRIVAQRLESLNRAGVEQIRRPRKRAAAAGPPAATPATVPEKAALPITAGSVAPPSPSTPPPVSRPASAPAVRLATGTASAQALLDELNQQVRGCTLCRDLACTRKQTVFGVGNPAPRVAFLGEAPGADEDRQGEPFVGRAGQLLTKIIEACGWQRSDVYILNVLKCRPPENRNPLPAETENCRQYFERQFEILHPEYIVCVGTVPAQALLQTTEPVGRLRGRFHQYKDAKVLVTYHPSYLLRNPSAKKYVWEDMQVLLKEMGLPVPGRESQ